MLWFRKKKPLPPVEDVHIPRHVGIIMDGNGRWAKQRGLPRKAGHAAGAQVFRKITKHCEKRGVQVLTVYAFSTENWKRPPDEVEAIMNLLRDYLKESLADFKKENIITRFIGDLEPLAPDIRALMAEAEESTARKTGMVLNIAINYGGRLEIAQAARQIAGMCRPGGCRPRRWTRTRSPRGSIPPDSPTSISSCAQAGNTGYPISSSGRARMRNMCSTISCGRISPPQIWTRRWRNMRAATAASEGFEPPGRYF